MEIKSSLFKIKLKLDKYIYQLKAKFFKISPISQKQEVNSSGFKWVFLLFVTLFIAYVLLMPDETKHEFSQKIKESASSQANGQTETGENSSNQPKATSVWSTQRSSTGYANSGGSQINYNTPMVINSKLGNAKNQFRAGIRIPLKIIDKFIVSQDPVPILAESILDSSTDSGIRIPAGTRFYGEASYQKGSERAQITFKQMSLPSGDIKPIAAIAIDKEGQTGVVGKVHSDGVKNTTGQILTSFVGGLAAGSIQTDAFGHSKGGIENGLLTAVAETAKTRAQNYGEKLKAEREWIEVPSGSELDALLKESLNLNEGGQQ